MRGSLIRMGRLFEEIQYADFTVFLGRNNIIIIVRACPAFKIYVQSFVYIVRNNSETNCILKR